MLASSRNAVFGPGMPDFFESKFLALEHCFDYRIYPATMSKPATAHNEAFCLRLSSDVQLPGSFQCEQELLCLLKKNGYRLREWVKQKSTPPDYMQQPGLYKSRNVYLYQKSV